MKIGQYFIIKLIICWCNQKCLVTYQKSLEIFQGSFAYGGSKRMTRRRNFRRKHRYGLHSDCEIQILFRSNHLNNQVRYLLGTKMI